MDVVWFNGLTMCMGMFANTTLEPQYHSRVSRDTDPPMRGPSTPRVPYQRYLNAAMMLIKAAMPREDDIDSDGNRFDPGRAGEDAIMRSARCPDIRPVDCEDLLQCGFTESGIYHIWPRSRANSWGENGFPVFCDMDTDGGGWTVIQRRDDFGSTSDFFFKDWLSYKFGFGDITYDFWLGNDKIFALSNQRRSTLRFDLLDFEGEDGWATYDNFYVDDESQGYRLHIGDYRGIIGDSFRGHNLNRFSTRDRDNDNSPTQNCALLYKGGWWYNNCHTANLNGLYLKGSHDSWADGVHWYNWKGFKYSLKRTEMKIRSTTFLQMPVNMANNITPSPPDTPLLQK